jgi:hypothetical protein
MYRHTDCQTFLSSISCYLLKRSLIPRICR